MGCTEVVDHTKVVKWWQALKYISYSFMIMIREQPYLSDRVDCVGKEYSAKWRTLAIAACRVVHLTDVSQFT